MNFFENEKSLINSENVYSRRLYKNKADLRFLDKSQTMSEPRMKNIINSRHYISSSPWKREKCSDNLPSDMFSSLNQSNYEPTSVNKVSNNLLTVIIPNKFTVNSMKYFMIYSLQVLKKWNQLFWPTLTSFSFYFMLLFLIYIAIQYLLAQLWKYVFVFLVLGYNIYRITQMYSTLYEEGNEKIIKTRPRVHEEVAGNIEGEKKPFPPYDQQKYVKLRKSAPATEDNIFSSTKSYFDPIKLNTNSKTNFLLFGDVMNRLDRVPLGNFADEIFSNSPTKNGVDHITNINQTEQPEVLQLLFLKRTLYDYAANQCRQSLFSNHLDFTMLQLFARLGICLAFESPSIAAQYFLMFQQKKLNIFQCSNAEFSQVLLEKFHQDINLN